MNLAVTDTSTAGSVTRQVDTLIIGSGFAGLGAAIRLTRAGKDFLVLERGAEVGGTWRDNTYPGAACDVPSNLYSYSFARNPNWTRSFSPQPEIQRYIASVADRYDVRRRTVFGCDVLGARWNTATFRWDVQTSRGDYSAKILISAIGALCEPSLPDIPGIESFDGEIFHSARWNHEADLTGKRVAVIGTGASAIQIVPAIAGRVEHLDVYQRTAPWVLPRSDREYTKAEHLAFKYVPGAQRLSRALQYLTRETQVVGLAKAPIFMKPLEIAARLHLRRQLSDPALRRKVTPDFRIGCKRMLISNNYFPALARPNVDVVTDGIAEVRTDSIVTRDGTVRTIDALVVATGFHVTDSPTFAGIIGKDGRSLAEVFDKTGMQGYKGSAVAGFPNLFFLVGPNTGLGHSSMVYMIESQLNYVVDAIETLDRHRIGTVEVRQKFQDEYNRDLQNAMRRSVWNTGGCASWYLDKHGNNTTLWPGFTFEFRRLTKHFDLEAYRSVAAADLTPSVATAVTEQTDEGAPSAGKATVR